MKYSKNAKLNAVLNEIEESLRDIGIPEIKRYIKEFPDKPDYNLYTYGNLLIYNDDIINLYTKIGNYKNKFNYTETYKRQVGYVARCLVNQELSPF